VIVVVPPIEELDLVAPLQVFGAANRLSEKKVYSLEIATNGKELEVPGEGGMLSFLAQRRIQEVKGRIDSILLVCGVGTRLDRDPELSRWLTTMCPTERNPFSV
jgi:transcriptional regulator GlxA family with amidase domain